VPSRAHEHEQLVVDAGQLLRDPLPLALEALERRTG